MWTKENVRFLPLVGFCAGIAAGALGIAAGTLLGPLLLELGVMPMVSVGTTGEEVTWLQVCLRIARGLLEICAVAQTLNLKP